MGTKNHPLAPLHALREQAAEDASRELGEARRREEKARVAEREAIAALGATVQKDERLRAAEALALAGGTLRAGDLALAARWEIGAEERRLTAQELAYEARVATKARGTETEASRAKTAQQMAEADAVARLLERAEEARRAKEDAAAEEAAEEANASGARTRKSRADERK